MTKYTPCSGGLPLLELTAIVFTTLEGRVWCHRHIGDGYTNVSVTFDSARFTETYWLRVAQLTPIDYLVAMNIAIKILTRLTRLITE